MSKVLEIPIEKIKVGVHDQRVQIDDDTLDGLVSSIARVGLVYPCVVVPEGEGYLLVEGHRRLVAHRRLGKDTVTCMVKDCGIQGAAEIAFAGNFFRKDLSPVELAAAIRDCVESKQMTAAEIATGFHRTEKWVNGMISICDWPSEILEAVHKKLLSVSAASNLAVVNDETYRAFLVRNAVEQGATARTTAGWLQAYHSMQPAEEAVQAEPEPGRPMSTPAVPQAPCFCCADVFFVNEMSHVPMCGGCVKLIRQVGTAQG